MTSEPVAQGIVVPVGNRHAATVATLTRETSSMLRALRATAAPAEEVRADADFVILLVEEGSDPRALALPDLKDRAASVMGYAENPAEGRVVIAQARKHLRAHGATLGSRELVFTPEHFGHIGMESDAMREKLEILIRTLVLDAERLRLRREGWEEPLE